MVDLVVGTLLRLYSQNKICFSRLKRARKYLDDIVRNGGDSEFGSFRKSVDQLLHNQQVQQMLRLRRNRADIDENINFRQLINQARSDALQLHILLKSRVRVNETFVLQAKDNFSRESEIFVFVLKRRFEERF